MNAPRTYSVLLVDDVAEIRDLLHDVMKTSQEFVVVAEARDGREAIERATETQPDLILLDLSMPTMDGLEALPELRRISPGSRIVVFTGFGEDRMSRAARVLGAAMYIEKGASPRAILAALRQAVGAEEA